MRTSAKKRVEPRADRGEPRGQELQRDRLAELEVVGAVDLAHAAAAEQADDPVALREHRAGQEVPRCRSRGRPENGEPPAAGVLRVGSSSEPETAAPHEPQKRWPAPAAPVVRPGWVLVPTRSR